MKLVEALELTAELVPFPSPRALEDDRWLVAAGRASSAARLGGLLLAAEQAVQLVIATALVKDQPLAEVERTLRLEPLLDGGEGAQPPSVRDKRGPRRERETRGQHGALGEHGTPAAPLFPPGMAEWAHRSASADRWCGLSLYALDGAVLRVADSAANREGFGGEELAPQRKPRGEQGPPRLRLGMLLALRSRVVAAASFGPCATPAFHYAAPLGSALPDRCLVLLDRPLVQPDVLLPLGAGGAERHWISRVDVRSPMTWLDSLGPSDRLVELPIDEAARRRAPALPATWRARAIHYQRSGYQNQLLVTSLVDAERYPAPALRQLFHERGELELGFLDDKAPRPLSSLPKEPPIALRGISPAEVARETWALLLVHNLVRLEIERVAAELTALPSRVDFAAAARECAAQWHVAATQAPEKVVGMLATAADRLRAHLAPPQRPGPVFPLT